MGLRSAKRKMLDGQPAIGAPVSLGAPIAAELLSRMGFDFILVDNQHGAWDDASSMLAFRSICLGTATPMVRVQSNDYYAIGRMLDRGALGIVVPMVNTVDDARRAAFAVRYPPQGGRSWGPFGTGFLGDDYGAWVDEEVFLAVQIETIQAAEHAQEILSVDGVDGCWIGPADLARSMGIDLTTADGKKAHEAAIQGVLDVCRSVGKVPGIAAGDGFRQRIAQGFLFVTTANDSGFIAEAADRALKSVRT
ncbi:MAG: aldolase [Chloroflexi bacterium]|nr:aldolase [Chloroflexota bacterium]